MSSELERVIAKNNMLSDVIETLTDEQIALEAKSEALSEALAICSGKRQKLVATIASQAEQIKELVEQLESLTDIPF